MINEQLQNVSRIAYDVGLATWFGGQVFGKFALNPTVAVLEDKAERGKVVNSGWFTFNPFGVAGLAAAGATRIAARQTEQDGSKLTTVEQRLTLGEDILLGTSVALTLLTGIQGARLAKQAPDGAVPIESGTEPAPETPPKAAGLQRSIGALGNGAILAGLGVLSLRSVQDRLAFSRPSARRGLTRLRTP